MRELPSDRSCFEREMGTTEFKNLVSELWRAPLCTELYGNRWKWFREAYVLSRYAARTSAKYVWLSGDSKEGIDGFVRYNDLQIAVEIVEVIEPGFMKGAYWKSSSRLRHCADDVSISEICQQVRVAIRTKRSKTQAGSDLIVHLTHSGLDQRKRDAKPNLKAQLRAEQGHFRRIAILLDPEDWVF